MAEKDPNKTDFDQFDSIVSEEAIDHVLDDMSERALYWSSMGYTVIVTVAAHDPLSRESCGGHRYYGDYFAAKGAAHMTVENI